jgi:hypothetical protein
MSTLHYLDPILTYHRRDSGWGLLSLKHPASSQSEVFGSAGIYEPAKALFSKCCLLCEEEFSRPNLTLSGPK